MSARSQILSALRDAKVALPAAGADVGNRVVPTAVAVSELLARFSDAVAAASGRCHMLDAGQSVGDVARTLFPDVTRVAAADGLWMAHEDVVEASTLQLVLAHGRMAVAENGAIWVDGTAGVPRDTMWLCEHLVLVVSADDLVIDMHQAYDRLARRAMPDFGCFISGPSKTADIEQCLVIGAHGPLSLDVLVA